MNTSEILKKAGLPENPTDILGRKFWLEGILDWVWGADNDSCTLPCRVAGLITGLSLNPLDGRSEVEISIAPIHVYYSASEKDWSGEFFIVSLLFRSSSNEPSPEIEIRYHLGDPQEGMPNFIPSCFTLL